MQQTIFDAIQTALHGLGTSPVDFVVEHPTDLSHGDYATNVAMAAAKQVGENPRQFAERIVAALETQSVEHIDRIEIAGPGFINFTLARNFFVEQVAAILSAGDRWGRQDDEKGETVLLEYTSPNLFKPLHVGNLVGNIIGESLARLYEYNGADVKRINYPSDIGLTVAKGVWGLQKTGGDPDDIHALGEAYRYGNEAYEHGGTEKEEIEAVNRALYANSDPELSKLRERGLATSRERLAELCRQLGTEFDTEIFESEAGPVGKKLVEEHISDGVFRESEGAVVFPGEEYGLHTRVFLNSQGLPTYEAKDLGNFVLKQERYAHWTKSFVVTGGEQREYFKVVIAATKKLFPAAREKELAHIPTGFLTLTTGKMSSRKGNVLTGESLLAEMRERAYERAKETRAEDVDALGETIAVAALKYQILRSSAGTDIVFDKERALSFEGDSGPYLQYTHARILSVLERAGDEGITASHEQVPDAPYVLERILYQFPEAIVRATEEHDPHHLTTYLTELAGVFNTFYGQEKIADARDPHAPYKVALTAAVAQTLKNGLWCLGIPTPERM